MNCELCGTDSGSLEKVVIERSVLRVCPQCSRFGKPLPKSPSEDPKPTPGRAPWSARRVGRRDIFEESGNSELVFDYPLMIKTARLSKDWTPEQLGKAINEKKSIITKLEAGEIRPDKKLISKLERELNIKLTEKVDEVKLKKKKARPRLLGDIVKIE